MVAGATGDVYEGYEGYEGYAHFLKKVGQKLWKWGWDGGRVIRVPDR